MPVTKTDVRLGYCIVSNASISPEKSQRDLNYHVVKKHGAQKPNVTFKFELFNQGFPGFTLYDNIKNTQYGFLIKTAILDPEIIINHKNNMDLKEELRSCQHFLGDSELEMAAHKVFNYSVENLNETIVNGTLDRFIYHLQCARKVNLAF